MLFATSICLSLNQDICYGQSGPIKIVPNYNKVSSISKLLNPYEGKPISIDLWATWCQPCIDEFQSTPALYNFLRNSGIEMVYVSLDEHDSIWQAKIKEFNLLGTHIRANKMLQDSLSTLVWGAPGGYSIPTYLLFDKKGKLVSKNLSAPSSGAKLFREITEALK